MKFTLGTVQFGLKYGISNTHGIPNDNELNSILILAKENGINSLDTASSYGNSEERIGQNSELNFNVISKFPALKSGELLKLSLEESLQKLKVKSLYGYLAHSAENLIENPLLWDILLEAKNDTKIAKIGYSLYSPEQLEKLLQKNLIPDLVQIPYSLLDRRFANYITILKNLGVEIHIRSIFLQGLYFMNPSQLPLKLNSLAPALTSIGEISKSFEVSIAEIALNYLYTNTQIDQLVIGVENTKQLSENINLVLNWKKNSDIFSMIEEIDVKDKYLLNPSNW